MEVGTGAAFYSHRRMKFKHLVSKLVLLTVFLAAAGAAYSQQGFNNYTDGDVLVCFRNTASAANDLVVDCGPVSTFTNLTAGQSINITTYYSTSPQLAAVGTNNVAWSAVSANFYGNKSCWVTRPRLSYGTQSTPWTTANYFGQSPIASKIDGIGEDAMTIASGLPAGASNTVTAVVEPETGNLQTGNGCYKYYVGSSGNLGNTLPGTIEQTTPSGFTTGAQNVRADFYQLLTNNAPAAATYLGYFELSTNGVLTYYSGASASSVTAPVITSVTRSGTTNTVTFTTGSSGTYSLRGTNSTGLAAARITWPAISSVSGNGSPQSLKDVDSSGLKFYVITAQ